MPWFGRGDGRRCGSPQCVKDAGRWLLSCGGCKLPNSVPVSDKQRLHYFQKGMVGCDLCGKLEIKHRLNACTTHHQAWGLDMRQKRWSHPCQVPTCRTAASVIDPVTMQPVVCKAHRLVLLEAPQSAQEMLPSGDEHLASSTVLKTEFVDAQPSACFSACEVHGCPHEAVITEALCFCEGHLAILLEATAENCKEEAPFSSASTAHEACLHEPKPWQAAPEYFFSPYEVKGELTQGADAHAQNSCTQNSYRLLVGGLLLACAPAEDDMVLDTKPGWEVKEQQDDVMFTCIMEI